MDNTPKIALLTSPDWHEYELVDSGDGRKLERYGKYLLSRPETQALWKPGLSSAEWEKAHAYFQPTDGESGGIWKFLRAMPREWVMEYKGLKFLASASGSRHVGVFPEQANHWDWIESSIRSENRPVKVLNLFGYTGLSTLAAARAGASVTHVDASKKSIKTAQRNQELSHLKDRSIRWLVDDASKFVQREQRRGNQYDGLILDPPKFGRGPQGQVWELFESLSGLLKSCSLLFSQQPLFVVITLYAVRASFLSVYYAVKDILQDFGGTFEIGELVLVERSAGRMLSSAIYTRWRSKHPEETEHTYPQISIQP